MFKSASLAMVTTIRRFMRDARGATSIEYALIASGISVAIVGVLSGLGSNVKGMYANIATALK